MQFEQKYEPCVVCGDRASGKKKNFIYLIFFLEIILYLLVAQLNLLLITKCFYCLESWLLSTRTHCLLLRWKGFLTKKKTLFKGDKSFILMSYPLPYTSFSVKGTNRCLDRVRLFASYKKKRETFKVLIAGKCLEITLFVPIFSPIVLMLFYLKEVYLVIFICPPMFEFSSLFCWFY